MIQKKRPDTQSGAFGTFGDNRGAARWRKKILGKANLNPKSMSRKNFYSLIENKSLICIIQRLTF